MATISKEQLKQAIVNGKDILKKINEQVPVPVKNIGNKAAYYGSFRMQKIIFVYTMLVSSNSRKTFNEAFSEVNGKKYEEIVQMINQFIAGNKRMKIQIALFLVASDFIQQGFIAIPIAKRTYNTLGAAIYKIFDKVMNIFRKKQPQAPETKTLLEKLKERTMRLIKREQQLGVVHDVKLPTEIQDVYNFILVLASIGGFIEEVSKSIAHDLKADKQYLTAFLIIENFGYGTKLSNAGLSFKQIIKLRSASILMHITMAILHRIPKLRKFTYLLHPLFNIVALIIESQQFKR